ncbi:hypothetical protein AX15_005738 [Amanita polypyramis BW_CC]|nr:hypothetical protein AX15_005738 [Amanita polypyramis BW_CC]
MSSSDFRKDAITRAVARYLPILSFLVLSLLAFDLCLNILQDSSQGKTRRLDIQFALQLTYPGTRISTLKELFAFANCVDPKRKIRWNIESKINSSHPASTHDIDTFVTKQYAEFARSSYTPSQIIYQSLDWRTLVAMKRLDSRIRTSALISPKTVIIGSNTTSPWQAGIRLEDLPGPSLDVKIANAAHSIKADVLSPAAAGTLNYLPFTTQAMIKRAHELDMQVIPWTVNSLSLVEELVKWGVEGVITDYPGVVRR